MEIKPADPYTKDEIIQALGYVRDSMSDFFQSLDLETFFKKPDQGWSAAENVKHLIKTSRAAWLGVALPKFQLILFGFNKARPRRLSEVKDMYLTKLAQGAGAGIYTPLSQKPPARAGEKRDKLLSSWRKVCDSHIKALDGWSEADLDRYRLPHPILGNVPVREMMIFIILHGLHHQGIVERRLKEQTGIRQPHFLL